LAKTGVLDPSQGPLVDPRQVAIVELLVPGGELAAEVLGLGADGVDQGGGLRGGEIDLRGLQVLGEDARGGAVVGTHVEEARRGGLA
jgi:hypothetical protein